jgi:6-pyruvoyltetrahydropterin/6-carboxytetrahydropterin synthase
MHRLIGHPKCGTPHGHTYTVEVCVEGPVRGGMVMDFDDLKRHVRAVIAGLDHTDLNRIVEVPTCENLCTYVLEELRRRLEGVATIRVRIWEGEGKYAEDIIG